MSVLWLLLWCALLVPGSRSMAISFPADSAVINVKTEFGAVGNGVADDTAALQAAFDASCGVGGPTRVVFIPNGTYRLTNTLVAKFGVGPWVYGESRDGVVLRLDDGVTNSSVTSVLRGHPSDTTETSADYFMRNFRNFTVNVGNNPGIDGIRWYGNNSSILQNVRVIGTGNVGINSGYLGQNGPNLIQDVVVEGFQTGIQAHWSWGQTISRATIRNCAVRGVSVVATCVAIEDLVVENTPVALNNFYPNDWTWWGGVVSLIGGQFSGGGPTQPAIQNTSYLYVRDVTATGFQRLLSSTTPGGNVEGGSVSEYLSHAATKAFPDSLSAGIRLPIKTEPIVSWETNLANWVCANDYGAIAGDNQDDTAAIQAAIDAAAAAGKTVVYLRGIGGGDPNWLNLNGEVRVHGSVRQIMSFGFGRILGNGDAGRFVIDDTSASVVKFMHLQSFGGSPVIYENRSATKTLVLESCDAHVLGTGTGDIFVTDCPASIELRNPAQSLWARQLNPEGFTDIGLVRNHGGKLWALGVKHEGAGVRYRLDNGSQSEVFGVFNYGPGLASDDLRPCFLIDNAAFCLMGIREIAFSGNAWNVEAREIRGSEVRTIPGNGWIAWPMYSAYTSAQLNGATQAAAPVIQPEKASFIESQAVTASTTTNGAVLRYTLDGSEPTASSPTMPQPLVITQSADLRVRAFHSTLAPSVSSVGTYTQLIYQAPLPPPLTPRSGLAYDYYELATNPSSVPDFANLTPVRTGVVSGFDLSPRLRDGNIAFRFTGTISVPADGLYNFRTSSDDGSLLWINDTLVVNNDGLHGVTERAGFIALRRGVHAIKVGWFNAGGGFNLSVSWSGPGFSQQAIPDGAFVVRGGQPAMLNAAPGLAWEYFEGSWSSLPDFDSLPVIASGTADTVSTAPRLRDDFFGLRFKGWIQIPADGSWTFSTTSDDGSKLFIDGVEVVNNNFSQAATKRTGTVALTAGLHSFMVTFFEGTGSESLSVGWEGPGVPEQAIPASAFANTPRGHAGFWLENGQLYLRIVRPIVAGAGNPVVETSDDLVTWRSSPADVAMVEMLSLPPYELATFRRLVPASSTNPRGFLRLRLAP